jgi:SAM-dependent methyltransferase
MLSKKFRVWMTRPVLQKFIALLNRCVELFCVPFEKFSGYDFKNDATTSYLGLRNHPYAQGSVVYLRIFMRELIDCQYKCFVDIGCGKGRMLLHAARSKCFNRVIGVEVSEPLFLIASQNIKISRFAVQLKHEDAEGYSLPGEPCLIYLYNPFDNTVMSRFLERNRTHFKIYNSCIIYHNNIYSDTLEQFGFTPLPSRFGYKTSFYRLSWGGRSRRSK